MLCISLSLHSVLFLMLHVGFWSSGMHRKQNICQIVFGFKSTLTPCTFSFSSFFPFLFLPHIFLLDIKPGFIFGRKGVLENFCDYRIRRNIVQVDSGWVVVTVFFFAFLSGPLNWIMLIWVWLERSLPAAQVRCQSCWWLLKLMKSQAVEGTYIPTSGYGWFRCGWVKISGNRTVSFAVTKREMFSGCGKNALFSWL